MQRRMAGSISKAQLGKTQREARTRSSRKPLKTTKRYGAHVGEHRHPRSRIAEHDGAQERELDAQHQAGAAPYGRRELPGRQPVGLLTTTFTSAPNAALMQVKQRSRSRIYSDPNGICSVSPILHHVQRSPTSPPMGSPGAARVAVRPCYGRGQRVRPR